MGQKITVGLPAKGLRNDVLPFGVDNDNFPVIINAYQHRGKVKRKRGTGLLNRLKRYFNSSSISYNTGTTTITLDGSGIGNLFTGFSLETNGNIVPGSVILTGPGGPFTDPTQDGYLTPTGTSGPNTINYAIGQITIPAQAGSSYTATFNYYPDLPVMGLRDLILNVNQFPGTLAFDTKYSYNINKTSPYSVYDVSFYKNPAASADLPGYIPKTNPTPTSWNGQDYQQFWTVNYQGALWATNGITIPFSVANVGMQYNTISNITTLGGAAIPPGGVGTPAIVRLFITGHGLVQGDFLFINEVTGTTGINFQTGYVISANPQNPNFVDVEFPYADIRTAYASGGIAQYLTNRSDVTKDCLRFYDGDPTNGNATTPALTGVKGWVNFAPPLSFLNYSIADLPAAQYYLVGARIIYPFKDRLIFVGPVVQTSSPGSQKYLQDTVIYSQNGTPYYTASYIDSTSNYPLNPTTPPGYFPILLPDNQTSTPTAYFEDLTGFGGFTTAGVDKPITTLSQNEDVLILGFDNHLQTRLVYSGNDIIPFNFFFINGELGSSSTFSAITMDKGVITRGNRGIIITTQVESRRIDLDIPDEVFEMNLLNNGTERITAQRDYINEWIYLTYPKKTSDIADTRFKFPTNTLFYNYRDESWSIFSETYTTYGQFRKQTGETWNTLPADLTWNTWNTPWESGSTTLLQPDVIGGNQQGFVLFRSTEDTSEAPSLYIKSFSGGTITSPDHCLSNGDYIIIKDCLGTVASQVNGKIFSVSNATQNTFILNPPIAGGTYFGSGTITRMYVPYIQTKQFPVSWEMARKTRLGTQQYLFTNSKQNSQITLLIFLSQNSSDPYNDGPIVPANNVVNSSLVYSTILWTCAESTNLGLTPPNINLNMVTGQQQQQIWHRINTSLIGDTIQVGFTLSDAQMRAVDDNGSPINQFAEIELHAFILDVNPSQVLA